MNTKIGFEREEDGRWIADIPELPGVMAYERRRATPEINPTIAAIVPRRSCAPDSLASQFSVGRSMESITTTST